MSPIFDEEPFFSVVQGYLLRGGNVTTVAEFEQPVELTVISIGTPRINLLAELGWRAYPAKTF
jgi:hypothetical protein